MKKKLIIIGIILTVVSGSIILFLGYKWVSPRFFPPDSIYRSPTASAAGHTIKIDNHYHIVTTSATTSYLWFVEEGENPITLIEYVEKLNYNDSYIIVQSVTKNNDSFFFKEYQYFIVDKETQKVDSFSKKNDFLDECQKKNIDLDLKIKEEFDWY